MKKHQQLGMNPSTASHRLVKDILFNLINIHGYNKCHHCGKEMTRETFSVEHIEPWLDSDNPLEKFFDLNNISFSHRSCNTGQARKPNRKYSPEERQVKDAQYLKEYKRRTYDPDKRHEKWIRTGT